MSNLSQMHLTGKECTAQPQHTRINRRPEITFYSKRNRASPKVFHNLISSRRDEMWMKIADHFRAIIIAR